MVDDERTQPIQDGTDDAANSERIAGIVEQVTQDVRMGHAENVRDALRQRLEEAGLPIDDSGLDSLVRTISAGS